MGAESPVAFCSGATPMQVSTTALTCSPFAMGQAGQTDAECGEFSAGGFGVRATCLGVASLRVFEFGHRGIENQSRGGSSQSPRPHQRGRRGADLTDGQLRVFPPAVVAALPTGTGGSRR